jgi:hypothetical protein
MSQHLPQASPRFPHAEEANPDTDLSFAVTEKFTGINFLTNRELTAVVLHKVTIPNKDRILAYILILSPDS